MVRTRSLASTAVVPQLLWCMHCLRTSTKNFDPHGGVPFAIDCVFDAKKSILCAQCSRRPDYYIKLLGCTLPTIVVEVGYSQSYPLLLRDKYL
jgi:hypothetical protein